MTNNHLLLAINECNNGHLAFKLGTVRAFLYGKKWYPLRATINRSMEHANKKPDLTTDRALVALVYLGMWTRIEDKTYENHFPIDAQPNEVSDEIMLLSELLYKMTR